MTTTSSSSSRPPPRPHHHHRADVRVLVVDDSAFARKVMREVLEAHPRIEVVGLARDGVDALEKIAELKPDVITLDLVMPHLDGVGVLDAIGLLASPPRAVVVTTADTDSALVVAALLSGAFAIVHKPTSLATDRLYELGGELVQKVLIAADVHVGSTGAMIAAADLLSPGPIPDSQRLTRGAATTQIVVVGASTGGPRAITHLLRELPETFPVPLAIVVHMPTGYTDAFASRLDRESRLDVVEAKDGCVLRPGLAVIARAGIHMNIQRVHNGVHNNGNGNGDGGTWRVALKSQPVEALHRPSVDALFESAANEIGRNVLGVVLTGMGSDGLVGARAIRAVGGQVIVEDESTCVVYGMPRAIADEGLANATFPLPDIAAAIMARL